MDHLAIIKHHLHNARISALIKSVILIYGSTRIARVLIKYLRTLYAYRNIKHDPIIPFVGNMYNMPADEDLQLAYSYARTKRFNTGPGHVIWRSIFPVFVLTKAEFVENIVKGSKHVNKGDSYEALKSWLGDSVLLSKDEKWSGRRKLLTPTLHFDILKDFLHVMNDKIETMIVNLREAAVMGRDIDIFETLGLCTLGIICETAMGLEIDTKSKSGSEYINAVANITRLVRKRIANPLLKPDFIYYLTSAGRESIKYLKIVHDFTDNVIRERNKDFDLNNLGTNKRIAFLDLLLKMHHQNDSISLADIRSEVDTFMFAGHDTTTTAASWACHLIGRHPDIQKKIHDEIDSVFQQSYLSHDDLANLKYLECVIKESMRIFPPVPFFGRILSEDTQVGDHTLLEGTSVTMSTYSIHRDEEHYPNPEKFDPDRFLPENLSQRPAYAFIPFAAGRRNCLGQRFAMIEMKLILANIFKNYSVKSMKTTEELKPRVATILKAKNGIPIKLTLRDNVSH